MAAFGSLAGLGTGLAGYGAYKNRAAIARRLHAMRGSSQSSSGFTGGFLGLPGMTSTRRRTSYSTSRGLGGARRRRTTRSTTLRGFGGARRFSAARMTSLRKY